MMTACLDADAIGAPSAQVRERLRVLVRGAVQGVGFRPFVYRLARELSLAGWVQDSTEGVTIEVEGAMPDIAFTNCTACRPRYSIIHDLPYDRARTTMARFTMCGRCREEYDGASPWARSWRPRSGFVSKRGDSAMCLAVPGRVVSVSGDDPISRMGRVDFGGIEKQVSLAFVPEAREGDFVLVHVGFAISRVDEEEARKVFDYLKEIDALERELS